MSTCSQAAYLRGPNQKVVSFSYYGDPNSFKHKRREYFNGIFRNYKAIQKFYGNWTMRLYHDFHPNHEGFDELCEFACDNPQFDLCDIIHLTGLARWSYPDDGRNNCLPSREGPISDAKATPNMSKIKCEIQPQEVPNQMLNITPHMFKIRC